MRLIYRFALRCFNLAYPVKVYGKENVPEGKAILVCNHFRAIDPGFVADVYFKDTYFMAKQELFNNKLLAKILKGANCIPIDREKPSLQSLMKGLNALKYGHKLVIFPEGTRNKSGTDELQEIKGGSGVFAVKSKAPIVPLMILKKSKCFRRTHIIVGQPFELSEYYGKKLSDEDIVNIDKIISEKMREQHVILKEIIANKKNKKKVNKVENADNQG